MIPQHYPSLHWSKRKTLREAYVKHQEGLCYWCKEPLAKKPPERITNLYIRWESFPPNFLRHPVHLQHNHDTGMTEGAVHAYCNAVMWQYYGR